MKIKSAKFLNPSPRSLIRSLAVGLAVVLLAAPAFPRAVDVGTPEDEILAKGFEAYMDGRDKVALSYFEEVVRINPKNAAAKKAIDKVQIRMKKKESLKKKKARVYAAAKVREGRELLKTNDVISAIDAFHAALDRRPDGRKAKKELARIKKRTAKALKKNNMSLSSWAFQRGILAYLERDWAKAYRIWSERARIEPANVALAAAKKRAEKKFVSMMQSEREDFLRRGAREFYRQGLYHEALTAWEKILLFRDSDQEALEGKARAENALLEIQGKNRDSRSHELLEQGLAFYANQNFHRAKDVFTSLVQLDPQFKTAQEYLTKINERLSERQYIPDRSEDNKSWRAAQPSNRGTARVIISNKLENMEEQTKELESQLKRNPTDITLQQKLGEIRDTQKAESERIYKDGLIAYSQGNRNLAIDKWKQVLVINPDHKKAAAALRKAQAEEERSTQ